MRPPVAGRTAPGVQSQISGVGQGAPDNSTPRKNWEEELLLLSRLEKGTYPETPRLGSASAANPPAARRFAPGHTPNLLANNPPLLTPLKIFFSPK